MAEFGNIAKNTTFFQNSFLSQEIRILRTCDPRAKKFLKVLRKRFLHPESKLKWAMVHGRIFKICKYFWHIQYIPLQQISNICAARGKTFLNLIEDTCRYTLEFLGPNFLSNSQSCVLMKFTSLELLTLFLKLAKVVPKREIPS